MGIDIQYKKLNMPKFVKNYMLVLKLFIILFETYFMVFVIFINSNCEYRKAVQNTC